MGKPKVSIIGFCTTSRDMAPYDDPDMEFWGLNRGYLFQPKADRWFDLHGKNILFMQNRRPGKHVQWLKAFQGPVYVHERFDELGDNQVEFPLQAVADDLYANTWRMGPHIGRCPAEGCKDHDHSTSGQGEHGGCKCECHGIVTWRDMSAKPYITSSIAFEVALAIHERFEEIHLYGVDLNTESEYAWQKPGVEYLLGLAAGRGIKVVLPDNCPLLVGTLYGRGFKAEASEEAHSYAQFESRMKALQHDRDALRSQIAQAEGAKRELAYLAAQLIPGVDHEAVERAQTATDTAIVKAGSQLLTVEGGLSETSRWFAQRLATVKAEQQDKQALLGGLVGQYSALMTVQSTMPNGLQHERMDDRRKLLEGHVNDMNAVVLALQGAMQEDAYWLHQTMDGQEPEEAIRQLRTAAYMDHDAEGPVTELELAQSTDPALLGTAYSTMPGSSSWTLIGEAHGDYRPTTNS